MSGHQTPEHKSPKRKCPDAPRKRGPQTPERPKRAERMYSELTWPDAPRRRGPQTPECGCVPISRTIVKTLHF